MTPPELLCRIVHPDDVDKPSNQRRTCTFRAGHSGEHRDIADRRWPRRQSGEWQATR